MNSMRMAPARSAAVQRSVSSLHSQNWIRRKMPTTAAAGEEGQGRCGPSVAEGGPSRSPRGVDFLVAARRSPAHGSWYCPSSKKIS